MRGIAQIALAVAILISAAPSAVAQVKRVETINDWGYFADDNPKQRTCFLATAPQSSEPAGSRRDSIYFYITAWPRDGVRTELSFKAGYPYRKGSEVTVTIGSDTFKLAPKDDRAFVVDPIEELKLLEAMKKGTTMVVQGVSARGTTTKDTFSLLGVSKAVGKLTAECN